MALQVSARAARRALEIAEKGSKTEIKNGETSRRNTQGLQANS
jgi:hypothetical protein